MGRGAAVSSSRFRFKARELLALAALALLVLVGLGLVYRQVNVQVTAVTNTLEQEVMAADRLLVETALSNDTELFTALLRRSPTWTDRQIRLQTHDMLFNRPSLGLWLDTRANLFANEFLSTTQVAVSPDLTTAELTVSMPYATVDEAGEIQTLTLQRTAVYRRQESGWLLAEPGDEFWGDYVHETRPYLDLITPARDQEIATRLADDLNAWIARICHDIECPQRFMLQLRLGTNPEGLLELSSPVRFSTVYLGGQQTTRLSLPTPTLVGMPVDEAGYHMLLRGYATHLALGLLNAYATNAPSSSLGGVMVNEPDFNQMLADWKLFVPWPTGYNPIQAAEPPPIPLPDQDILLLCQSSRAPNLYRYNSAIDLWSDIPLTAEGAIGFYLTAFPGGQGAALTVGPSVRDGLYRVIWLHNGREYLLFTSPGYVHINFVTEVEPGRFLLHYTTPDTEENGEYWLSLGVMVTANNCDDQTCTVQPFTQWAQPSPDGRHTLLTYLDENSGFSYALGNAAGEEIEALENAYNPFWLDGRTLAYLQVLPTDTLPNSQLMTAVFSEDSESVQIQPKLTAADIRPHLPELPSAHRLYLTAVMPYPAEQPKQLFLSIADSEFGIVRDSFLLQYEWQTEKFSLISDEEGDPMNSVSPVSMSVHGRYLITGNYTGDSFTLRLYDISGQTWKTYETPIPRFTLNGQQAWSDDGNWLILPDADAIWLVAPAYDYRKILFHGLDYCETALWVGRASSIDVGP